MYICTKIYVNVYEHMYAQPQPQPGYPQKWLCYPQQVCVCAGVCICKYVYIYTCVCT